MNKKFSSDLILKNALTSFKENSKYFFILGCIYSGLIYFLGYFVDPAKPEEAFIPTLIMSILLSLMYAKLAIMIHRSVLLQESDLSKMLSWTITEFKFALVLVGLYLAVFMIIGIISAFLIPFAMDVENFNSFSLILIPIFLILGLIVVSRVSLVFPAIAIRKNMKLADSWQQTKGYTFSLFVLLILIPFLNSFLQAKFVGDSPVLTVVFTVISVFVLIFEVTILSHCFVALFGEKNKSESEAVSEIM